MKYMLTIIISIFSFGSFSQESHILTCAAMTNQAQWHLQLKVEEGVDTVQYFLFKQEQRVERETINEFGEDYQITGENVRYIFDNPSTKDQGTLKISNSSDANILVLEGTHKLNGELKGIVIMGEVVKLDEDAFINEATLTLELEGEDRMIEFSCILL